MHVEASGLNEHDMFRKWEKLGSTLGVMGGWGKVLQDFAWHARGSGEREKSQRSLRSDLIKDVF